MQQRGSFTTQTRAPPRASFRRTKLSNMHSPVVWLVTTACRCRIHLGLVVPVSSSGGLDLVHRISPSNHLHDQNITVGSSSRSTSWRRVRRRHPLSKNSHGPFQPTEIRPEGEFSTTSRPVLVIRVKIFKRIISFQGECGQGNGCDILLWTSAQGSVRLVSRSLVTNYRYLPAC